MTQAVCNKLESSLAEGDFTIESLRTMSTVALFAAEGSVKIDGRDVPFRVDSPPMQDENDYHAFDHDYFVFTVGKGKAVTECEVQPKPMHPIITEAKEKFLTSSKNIIEQHVARFQSLRSGSTFVAAPQTPNSLEGLLSYFSVATVIGRLTTDDSLRPKEYKEGESLRAHNASVAAFWANRANINVIFANVGVEYASDETNKRVYFAIYGHKDDKGKGNPPVFFAAFDLKNGKPGSPILFIHNFNEDENRFYLKT